MAITRAGNRAKYQGAPRSLTRPKTPPAPMTREKTFTSQMVRLEKGIVRLVMTRKHCCVLTASHVHKGSTTKAAIAWVNF
jgi:hypothetical protein